MSKHDKDYDTSMLRFVGNLIAGQDNWETWTDQVRMNYVLTAIKTARMARTLLRADAKNEEIANGN